MNKALLAAGAISGAIAVAAGAFGAHALKDRLSEKALSVFETGARYQMYHALGLFAAAWLASRGVGLATTGGWIMLGGIVVFSGSLYALALTDTKWLGAITPLGGLAFIAGWVWLAISALR